VWSAAAAGNDPAWAEIGPMVRLAWWALVAGAFVVPWWWRERRAEARAIELAARPVDPWTLIDGAAVSTAIVTYVWGLPRGAVPGDHRDEVRRWYGARAEPCLALIAGHLEDAYRIPDWSTDTPEDAAERIVREVRATHPDLTDDAARSLAAWAVHAWTEWYAEPFDPADHAGTAGVRVRA
jgi:hypothetical protein